MPSESGTGVADVTVAAADLRSSWMRVAALVVIVDWLTSIREISIAQFAGTEIWTTVIAVDVVVDERVTL